MINTMRMRLRRLAQVREESLWKGLIIGFIAGVGLVLVIAKIML